MFPPSRIHFFNFSCYAVIVDNSKNLTVLSIMSSSFDYSFVPSRGWSMGKVREGLRCDKSTLHQMGVTLKAMLSARGLLLTSMKVRKNRIALSGGIDEFMKQAEFQALFHDIPKSWLKPALMGYAQLLNYRDVRIKKRPSSSSGEYQSAEFAILADDILAFPAKFPGSQRVKKERSTYEEDEESEDEFPVSQRPKKKRPTYEENEESRDEFPVSQRPKKDRPTYKENGESGDLAPPSGKLDSPSTSISVDHEDKSIATIPILTEAQDETKAILCLAGDLIADGINRHRMQLQDVNFNALLKYLTDHGVRTHNQSFSLFFMHRGKRISVNDDDSFKEAMTTMMNEGRTSFNFIFDYMTLRKFLDRSSRDDLLISKISALNFKSQVTLG